MERIRDDTVSKHFSAKDINNIEEEKEKIQLKPDPFDRTNIKNFSDFPQQPQKFMPETYSQQYENFSFGQQQQQALMMNQMMGHMMGSNPTEMQLQMMMKIFDEFKGIIKLQHESQMDLLNEKKLWHETMSRMNPYFPQSNTNPIMLTQQVPSNVSVPNQQKEYFSDVKNF